MSLFSEAVFQHKLSLLASFPFRGNYLSNIECLSRQVARTDEQWIIFDIRQYFIYEYFLLSSCCHSAGWGIIFHTETFFLSQTNPRKPINTLSLFPCKIFWRDTFIISTNPDSAQNHHARTVSNDPNSVLFICKEEVSSGKHLHGSRYFVIQTTDKPLSWVSLVPFILWKIM